MPDLNLNINAKDNASGKIKQVSGEILKAGAVMGGLRIAAKFAKEAIEEMAKSSASFKSETDQLDKTFKAVSSTVAGTLGDSFATAIKPLNEWLNSAEGLKTTAVAADKIVKTIQLLGAALQFNLVPLKHMITGARVVIGQFQAMGAALTGNKKEYQRHVDESKKIAEDGLKDTLKSTEDYFNGWKNLATTNEKDLAKIEQRILDNKKKANEKATQTNKDILDKRLAQAEAALNEELDAEEKLWNGIEKLQKDGAKSSGEAAKATASDWKDAAFTIADNLSSSFSQITSAVDKFFSYYIESQQRTTEEELAQVDTRTQATLTSLGLQDKTKSESLQMQLEELRSSLSGEKSEEKKANTQKEIQEKESELRKQQILDAAEAEKVKIKKASEQKKYELEVAAFRTGQGMKTAEIWIEAAVGIAKAWANMGPIFPVGPILAGVMTGLILTQAGVSTGLVWAQNPPAPPAFAEGGVSGGGMAMVGERGRELVNLPAGSEVINNTMTERLMGGMAVNVQVFLDSLSIPIARVLTENRRYELGRA